MGKKVRLVTLPEDVFFTMQTRLCQLADILDQLTRMPQYEHKKAYKVWVKHGKRAAKEGEQLSRYIGKYADRRGDVCQASSTAKQSKVKSSSKSTATHAERDSAVKQRSVINEASRKSESRSAKPAAPQRTTKDTKKVTRTRNKK